MSLTRTTGCMLATAAAVAGAMLLAWNAAATGGAYKVDDISGKGGDSTQVSGIADVGGLAMFSVCGEDDGAFYCDLWRSNGTAAGTSRVVELGRTSGRFEDRGPVAVIGGSALFPFFNRDRFLEDDDQDRMLELWRSDGTAASIVQQWPVGSWGEGRVVGGTLYFTVCDGTYGCELWKSDGTTIGTALVADIVPGPASSAPGSLTDVGGRLFFTADDGTSGRELWTSDASGTRLVADIEPGAGSSAPNDLVDVGGVLYFSAQDATGGRELWKSDGSAAGTMRVVDLAPGPASASPYALARLGDAVIFSTGGDPGGLWRSDGTGAVPLAAVQMNVGPFADGPSAVVGGILIFSGCEPTHGCEPWRTDGSAAGTAMVADVQPGPGGSFPRRLTAAGCTVFFHACGAQERCGVWRTSGAAAGTVHVAGVDPDYDIDDVRFGIAGGTMFASLSKSGPGALWAVPLATLDDCAADGFLCYDVSRRQPRLPSIRGVSLDDRFGAHPSDVLRSRELCTPAAHDGRPLGDETTHLASYRVRPLAGGALTLAGPLTLTNVLGEVTLVGRGPLRLLVPSAKDLSGPPSPPTGHDVDHYACYRARVAPGTDRPRSQPLTIGDGFTRPAEQFLVGPPQQLCVPVSKDGEVIKNSARHLVCYRARAVSSNAPLRTDVFTANGLGTERLRINRAEQLCLPSAEVPPAP